jgi:Integrase core domain
MDNRTIKKFYSNLARPAGFSSVDKLVKASKQSKARVSQFLTTQDSYTLHKPVRKRFPRNPYTVTNIDDLWEADLVDVNSYSKHNKGVKFLLNVIDTFSKYVWSVPLKNKTATVVANALEKIFKKSKRTPVTLQSDAGLEFNNKIVRSQLQRLGIKYHTTRNDLIKAAIVERYNRTQRSRMEKYFTANKTFNYLDILAALTQGYNDSKHSSTGMAPSKVTKSDVLEIWKRMQTRNSKIVRGKVKFHVGQHVRIAKSKDIFKKGYKQTFTSEIFKVTKVLVRTPQPVYEIEDVKGEPILGQFYNYELVGVSKNN